MRDPMHEHCRVLKRFLWAVVVSSVASNAGATAEVQALLQSADAFRLPEEAVRVETEVTAMKQGAPQKQRRYTVLSREDRRSLVLMRSPAEQGQKVLMLGDDYWLIFPKTQRPVRITPTQKLLGEASTGDIATMHWAGDYDGELLGEELCAEGGSQRCKHLALRAQRKGTTYARIELWLDAAQLFPVRADLYLTSDKLAKRASFTLSTRAGRTLVSEMLLSDEIQASRQTLVRYLSRVPRQTPLEWFNPMFLTRAQVDVANEGEP